MDKENGREPLIIDATGVGPRIEIPGMGDIRKEEPAKEVSPEDFAKLIELEMSEKAKIIAKYSVDPTKASFLPKDRVTKERVAEVLKDVENLDPMLKDIDVSTDQGLCDAATLFAGKAKSLADNERDSSKKAGLKNAGEEVLKDTSDVISGLKGKATAKVIRALMILMVAAGCAKGVAPRSTETAPPPSYPVQTGTATESAAATEAATITPEVSATPEVIDIPSCHLEQFWNCDLTESLQNGEYFRWLNEKVSKPFNLDKVRPLRFYFDDTGMHGKTIHPDIYSNNIKPFLNDPEAVPWHLPEVGYGVAYVTGPDGIKYPYIVEPAEYINKDQLRKDEPTKGYWVVTLRTTYFPQYSSEHGYNEAKIKTALDTVVIPKIKTMKVRPITPSDMAQGGEGPDPLIEPTFQKYPDMQERFDKFAAGDLSQLSQPDIILLTYEDTGTVFH